MYGHACIMHLAYIICAIRQKGLFRKGQTIWSRKIPQALSTLWFWGKKDAQRSAKQIQSWKTTDSKSKFKSQTEFPQDFLTKRSLKPLKAELFYAIVLSYTWLVRRPNLKNMKLFKHSRLLAPHLYIFDSKHLILSICI